MSTKILMIDDDTRYLDLMQMLLEGDGYEVIVSPNGLELSRLIERHRPDVVVLDVVIGEHNGIDLANSYLQSENSLPLPIVFVSAWTGVGVYKLPKNSLKLFKPFTHSELVSQIRRSLELVSSSIEQ